ncbi:clathrin light chain B isoform X5 [Paramormyrops kingsleyae]|uniref:clathrin light chain B isoform X5 n=1 Tax=Paramormyrops kingsleyae TaxID=1676925 RepID=UPI000CD66519|nr:clathrin light chain B isoform X5 [Paramormyrops kingsleyae]
MADDFGFFSSSGNGAPAAEDDPAAAFLAQQESEIAGIENDEAFGTLEEAEQPHYPPSQTNYNVFGEEAATVNGDMFSESNGPTDSYAAIARVDLQRQEPESLRRWREEQRARLEELDSASKAAEAEWKERAKKELEDWHVHQSEQMEKNKVNNRLSPSFARASEEAFLKESDEDTPGSEWERVARLCDFNPKTNKQSKDVSRMRSVLISLKQTPLLR